MEDPMLFLSMAILTGSDGAQTALVWYPLTEGMTWEYVITGTQSFGADTADITGSMTRMVTGTFQHSGGFPVVQIASNAVFTFTPRSGEDPSTSAINDTFYVYPADSLLLRYQSLDSAEPMLMMKLPLEVGSSWTFHPAVPTRDEVVSLDETVTVPAGTFAGCAHIHEPFTSPETAGSYNDFFFAGGTGLVRFVLHLESQDQTDDVVFDLRRGAGPALPQGMATGGMP
jgi:hypothetical protein